MVFNSALFVLFFLVVLCLYSLPIAWRSKKFILLLASYLFYAAWNAPFVVLLWFSTLVDWIVAKRIHATEEKRTRRGLLLCSLCVNLGLLCVFKYGDFLLANFAGLLHLMGFAYQPLELGLILPLGISFYTFQTLSYTIDVYRGNRKPGDSFLDYSLYVTFFPQLVAGPIVRAKEFIDQCIEPKRANVHQLSWGIFLLTLGLFQKAVLADVLLAPTAEAAFHVDVAGQLECFSAWVATMAFTSQVFFDFSGYSTCAIGAALCFGFRLPNNFNHPYASIGFTDFWNRWHISLSSWIRDYVFVSLGGYRTSLARSRWGTLRLFWIVLFTMFLGGLWHGAAWTMVAWGVLHGLYLVVEAGCRKIGGNISIFKTTPSLVLLGAGTFALVLIANVFFRSPSLAVAWSHLQSMFGGHPKGALLDSVDVMLTTSLTGLLIVSHIWLRRRPFNLTFDRMPIPVVSAIWALMLTMVAIVGGPSNAFIYFQF
ncbi:MAG: hypothetical protein A2289_08295 [Deltaproteobacteria bacterium RIFOXYA12_FULL_58_15]|nr:MAG: hypothetical protein A2289_08295 [Deltaproteobacteria bacterium RIFOXYA12_FULL_58_15]OGR09115.1 MAG: hypothetical protein A2341_10875 [Deltaproteobacteria bacterium RIFOXYB12_FULL_58_9]